MAAPSNRWPDRARLALSIVVNVEEGAELSPRDGDSRPDPVDELGVTLRSDTRNLGNESNYAYGIRAGAPRVLAVLARHEVRATFTAAAVALERAPMLAAAITAARHETCAHGYRWMHQHRMDENAEREFIAQAVRSIESSVGERPHGWLSRYLVTPSTRRLLAEAGFTYHMDDYSDDLPFRDPEHGILVMPYALDTNDMKMWTDPAYTPAEWLRYATDTFDCLWEEGAEEPKMMSLGVHLRIIGRPGRIGYLDRFLEHVAARGETWIAPRVDIARRWLDASA